MPDQADVRRIALALPEVVVDDGAQFGVGVRWPSGKVKGFAWEWLERVDPRRARVPQPRVLAVRVADDGEKQELLAADPDAFFTEPHYDGFPAVLVRLDVVGLRELTELVTDAWRCQAPKRLVTAFDAGDA